MSFQLQVEALRDNVKLPEYAHAGDAGMDVFAAEAVVLDPGARTLVSTGFRAAFPEGYVALVWDRSSYATKHGIKTIAGVIDSGYRGEWKIALINLSDQPFEIAVGDKIAQVLFQQVERAQITQVASVDRATTRGERGFGSTD